MGNTSGKGNSKSPELYQNARNIHAGLKTHRKHIESVTHTVKSQHAHVQVLLQNLTDLRRSTETKSSENTEGTEMSHNLSSQWERNTKRLLASVQSSLECQSYSLLTSFKTLNKSIFDIFGYYGIEFGSSNDIDVDLGLSEYDESYQKAYELRTTSENQVDKLEEENKHLVEDIQKTEQEMRELSKLKKDTEMQLHDYKEESLRLNEQTQALREKVKYLETNELSMKNVIGELKTDKEVLERLVKDLKEQRPVSIQLYYQVKGDMMSNILDELKSMLVNQMGVERSELQFIVCQNEMDVNPNIPLLVFCINASRLGTDVGIILQNLKVSSKVSVLIFHHKDIHALPNQASERVLTGPEFQVLGGIFDIAFLSEKGIYPCDMNHAAAVGIETFLRTQS